MNERQQHLLQCRQHRPPQLALCADFAGVHHGRDSDHRHGQRCRQRVHLGFGQSQTAPAAPAAFPEQPSGVQAGHGRHRHPASGPGQAGGRPTGAGPVKPCQQVPAGLPNRQPLCASPQASPPSRWRGIGCFQSVRRLSAVERSGCEFADQLNHQPGAFPGYEQHSDKYCPLIVRLPPAEIT